MNEVLSTTALNDTKRKKPLIKRWWLWVLLVIICIPIIGVVVSSSSEEYELSQLKTMNKQAVIQALGKLDKSRIIRDDVEGYYYMYPTGLSVFGNEKGVTEMILMSGDVEQKGNIDYKILGAGLGSSFEKAVKTMGNADWSGVSEGRQSVMYHDPKEDFILNLLTEANSDRIIGIRYVQYEKSDEAEAMNLLNFMGMEVPEKRLKDDLNIRNSIPNADEVSYYFASSTMENWIRSSKKDGPIFEIALSSSKFYNIGGLRIGDTYDKAVKLFGTPVESADGIDEVKLYTFEPQTPNTYKLEVSVGNGEIGFLKATLNSEDESVSVPAENTKVSEMKSVPAEVTEVVPQDMWDMLNENQKTEFNRFFSDFSEVNFGTNPYIKDSSISKYSEDELIKFAIEHNQKFGQGNSYDFDLDNDEYLSMHEDLVTEVIDYYFGLKINHKSVSGYDYKNAKYLWSSYRWGYADTNIFSQVQAITDNGDDTSTAKISIYQDSTPFDYFNSKDPNNVQAKSIRYKPQENWADDSLFNYIGSAVAIIKKSKSGDWQLINYEITSMY